ncbi:MAG: recombinase family protein [Firmicutes bacterium]|nr:recombinase family protein [Bacillota bacterium]
MYEAAAYIRVSTEDQTEYSPDAQLKAIHTYAKNNDLHIFAENIYTDAGISGRTAAKRPAFMQMIAAAKKHEFSVILVHKFDRFSRSRSESVAYKTTLKKYGVKVISVTEHIEDDKFGIILESILESMAEYYSLNLSEEVQKGQAEKALRGELQTRPCLGYKAENGNYIIIPDEAEYVRFIYDSFMSGKPLRQIAKELNNIGAVTKNGNRFSEDAVRYILKNPSYKGYSHWTGNNKSIISKSTWQPIIDEKQWENVNSKLKTPKHRASENKGAFSSLIKCSCCGSSLVYTKKRMYLQCCGYNHGKCKISHLVSVKKAAEVISKELENNTSIKELPDILSDNRKLKNIFEIIIFDKQTGKFVFYYKNN